MAYTATCIYCGQKFTKENRFKALQTVRIHLRWCPVKNAYKIEFHDRQFIVAVKNHAAIEHMQELKTMLLDEDDGDGIFFGCLLGMKKCGYIKDVRPVQAEA